MNISSLLFTCLFLLSLKAPQQFKSDQLRFERVRSAYAEKESDVLTVLKANSILARNLEVLICAYKTERILELWGRNRGERAFKLLKTYPFCALSGLPGPKRRSGDHQVPEGFYYIDRFNPASNYYLSLGINYPNESDKILGEQNNWGNDIFMHGKCVTVGCIPLTDDKIKELYIYTVEAKNNGQDKIPVYLFPFRLTDQNINLVKKHSSYNAGILAFWSGLKKGYEKFVKEKNVLVVGVDDAGGYVVR